MMMLEYVWMFLVTAGAVYGQSSADFVYPEHVHLSLGVEENVMTVTWVTFDLVENPMVEYGFISLNYRAYAATTVFHDPQSDKNTTRYVYRANMTDLKPDFPYYYHCGSPKQGWSNLFQFTNMAQSHSPWIAVYGDMGNVNAQSLTRLQEEVANRTIDVVMHIGDFAYNLDSYDGTVGDAFMTQIEPLAAYIPYMTCPGNHENYKNFSHYINRFTMPGDNGKMYYSFNLGEAHFISLNTEAYYYQIGRNGSAVIQAQKEWLIKDLQEANLLSTRAKRPWIITLGHRPMYCSIADYDDCVRIRDKVRMDLEDVLYKYGVDVAIWAHEHEYQRMWPIYNRTVCKTGQSLRTYTEPTAPTHIITGSAGCLEKHDTFPPKPDWVALNNLDYGYTKLKIINSTHLYLQQISDDKNGAVVDELTIIRQKHGAGMYFCGSN